MRKTKTLIIRFKLHAGRSSPNIFYTTVVSWLHVWDTADVFKKSLWNFRLKMNLFPEKKIAFRK